MIIRIAKLVTRIMINMIFQDLSGSNLNKNLMKKTHYRKAPTIFLGIFMNMLLSVNPFQHKIIHFTFL